MPSRCAALAVVLLLALPAVAGALPGDPGFEPLTPADGATVAVDPDGIPVTFTCPSYRSDQIGDFPLPGLVSNYGVTLSTSATVGADGRLASNVITPGAANPSGSGCAVRMGAGGPSPRIQETPGTYYWQVWRLCVGCPGSYEVGPVRTLRLASPVQPMLNAPRKAYAGYGFIAMVAASGAPDGTVALVERRVGSAWKRAGTGTVLGGRADAVVVLGRGTQQLRATVTIGAQAIMSPARSVQVVAARRWSTGASSDGSYKGRVGSRSVRFTVARSGRELRDFKAFVPMTCPGVTAGQFTTQIGTAAFKKVKIAPDGSFVAAASRQGTTERLRGRLKGRKVSGGRIELSVGSCVGNSAYSASR